METLSQRITSMESVQLQGIAVAFVTASALYYVLPAAISHIQLSALPMLGSELGTADKRRQAYLTNARQLYMDGYKKVL